MLIISVRDNENNSLKRKEKTNKETNSEKNKAGRGGGSYSERVRAEWFFKAIKLSGFLQLICKVSVILSRI